MIGSAGNELLALLLNHRIERPSCLENPCRRAKYSLMENVASPFQAEPGQGQVARTFVICQQTGSNLPTQAPLRFNFRIARKNARRRTVLVYTFFLKARLR
jgi:hypothetical protein